MVHGKWEVARRTAAASLVSDALVARYGEVQQALEQTGTNLTLQPSAGPVGSFNNSGAVAACKAAIGAGTCPTTAKGAIVAPMLAQILADSPALN